MEKVPVKIFYMELFLTLNCGREILQQNYKIADVCYERYGAVKAIFKIG